MTDDERDEINRLTELVGEAQKTLEVQVAHATVLAGGRIKVPQDRWDAIFRALANSRKRLDDLHQALEAVARQAGLPV